MIKGTKKSSKPISREDVSLSDRDILKRYLGITFHSSCSIQSPLRDDDHAPSFSIQEWNDRITWKDFGTGESGNVVGLMAKLWNVSYSDALVKLKFDEGSVIPRVGLIRRYKGKIHLTSGSSIRVRVREWKDYDVEFWKQFGISTAFCDACNVHPISHAFFTKKDENGITHTFSVPMDKYAYSYHEWKDGVESIKLYQPYSTTMKWLSKHDRSVWDLWKQAFMWAEKKSDEAVIITSSRKDAMCLWENLGIPAMSLQGEGYIPKPQVMKQVFQRFKKVYLWYDNDFSHEGDNPGQDNANKLLEAYPDLINICIPDDFFSKDPSDLIKNHGVKALKQVWNNAVKESDKKPKTVAILTTVMKRNNDKTKKFEKNIKEAVNTIYNMLIAEPLNVGFARYREDNAFVQSGCTLLNLGAVKNLGSQTKPSYVWNPDFTVNRSLIDAVIDGVRARQTKRIAVATVAKVRSSCDLSSFTDQQLWDELKARQFVIQNNQLCRMIYLQ